MRGIAVKDTRDSSQPPVVLSIAGSDSSGGAGIQTDLRTFAALGVYATTCITAVTAQSSISGIEVSAMETDLVDRQIEGVVRDFELNAVKTGMLATLTTVETVARWAAAGDLPNLVVDPVFAASNGQPLLEDGGIEAIATLLLPYCTIVTPNLDELALLSGSDSKHLTDLAAIEAAAHVLHGRGPAWVVATGGHLQGDTCSDVVTNGISTWVLESERIQTPNSHGTGCTLSSAIAAGLANGLDPLAAIRNAKDYVTQCLKGSSQWRLVNGSGPLDHMGWQ